MPANLILRINRSVKFHFIIHSEKMQLLSFYFYKLLHNKAMIIFFSKL